MQKKKIVLCGSMKVKDEIIKIKKRVGREKF